MDSPTALENRIAYLQTLIEDLLRLSTTLPTIPSYDGIGDMGDMEMIVLLRILSDTVQLLNI
jgi:hypothetical protein